MRVSILILILVVSSEQAGYTYNGQKTATTAWGRPIKDYDSTAFDAAQRRSQGSPATSSNSGISFGKIGGLTDEELKQNIDQVLAQYPGAVYSTGGRGGNTIQGRVPTRESYQSNFKPRMSQSYTPPPQPAVTPYNPPFALQPSRSRNSVSPRQAQRVQSSNYGPFQGYGRSNSYRPQSTSRVSSFSSSPMPLSPSRSPTFDRSPSLTHSQNAPIPPANQQETEYADDDPRKYLQYMLPTGVKKGGQQNQPQAPPKRVSTFNTVPPTQPANDYANNPMNYLTGAGLTKGGQQNQPQAQGYQPTPQNQGAQVASGYGSSTSDGLVGGGQKPAPPPRQPTLNSAQPAQLADDDPRKYLQYMLPTGVTKGGQQTQPQAPPGPVPTFNPADGQEAADNLASAIAGTLDYQWKTVGNIRGTVDWNLDLCERAVSNQQAVIQAMKKADRTLVEIIPIWKKSLAEKLSSFFVNTVNDPSYRVGSSKLDWLVVVMGECVRPKLVLAKI